MNPAIFDRPSGAGALLGVGDIATPTAGYSLRYLSINYFGQPVVRVRKDVVGNPEQDFTPNQINDGTLATFADGNDCFVSKWYDQFGSNDAEQTTAADQPKIWDASTGLVTENGKPAIDFSITDNNTFLENSSFQAFGISSRSVFIASNVFQVQNRPCLMYLGDNSGSGEVYALTLEYAVRVSGGNTVYDISQEIDNDQLSTFILPENNTNVDDVLAFKNSVNLNILSTSPLEIDTASGLIIGKYFTEAVGEFASLRGSVKEIIIYDSDQSANRTNIEDNINDYYDIY
jgi:hypothetical protein